MGREPWVQQWEKTLEPGADHDADLVSVIEETREERLSEGQVSEAVEGEDEYLHGT